MADRTQLVLLVLFVVLALFVDEGVWAFGAGNIPSFAYLEGRAFRHGDIEDILAELLKKTAGGFLSKGAKFGGLDIKRVYFGNWLRDYSQAVDIAGLKKLPLQTIINLCMALGFLANGYATGEFEVTKERLGCYLPTEHIDNPKGYADGEDARKYHPGLRPPVNPRELEIDPRTGMKNYIANESGTWDTSKALVRRTLERCIQIGRHARSSGRKEDEHEAYRLLGQLLHTLEDFPAHSNFCELTLISLGYTEVFPHVGEAVRIKAPNGRIVAPIVTGTFGSSDFIHSLLGEATDHISEASVTDLTKEMDKARSAQASGMGDSKVLRELFTRIPGLGGSDISNQMEGVERLSRSGQPGGGGKKPEDMTPEEIHATLWQILTFRDSIMKRIEITIEKIPGLSSLIEKLTDSIAVFVYTAIEPFIKPLLQTSTTQLSNASAEVINTQDQFEVFNSPHCSDPTHSFLSKDHFSLILNEPAGKLAQIIVRHVATLVVKAWDDSTVNSRDAIEHALECMFHPDFHNPNIPIQSEMMQFMSTWITSHGSKQREIIAKLSKESVRNHQATRVDDGSISSLRGAGYSHGDQTQGYLDQIPGVAQAQSTFGGPGKGNHRDFDPPMIASSAPYGHNPAGAGEAASYYNSAHSSSHATPSHPPSGAYASSDSVSVLGAPPSYSPYPDEGPSVGHGGSHYPSPSDPRQQPQPPGGSYQPPSGYPAPAHHPPAKYAAPAHHQSPSGYSAPPHQPPSGYPAPAHQPPAGYTGPVHHQSFSGYSAPPHQPPSGYPAPAHQRPTGYPQATTVAFEPPSVAHQVPGGPNQSPPGPQYHQHPGASFKPPSSPYPPRPGEPSYQPPHHKGSFDQHSPGYGQPHGLPGGNTPLPGHYPTYPSPGGHHEGKMYKKHGGKSGSGSGSGSESSSDSSSSHKKGKKNKKKMKKHGSREFRGDYVEPSYGYGGGYEPPSLSGFPGGPSYYPPPHGGPSTFPSASPGLGNPTHGHTPGAYAPPPGPPGHQSPYPPYGGGGQHRY